MSEETKPMTIWALPCPFRKDGSPVLGSQGRTIRNVVVMEMETWTKLCEEIPELGKREFRVGG